MTLNDWLHDNNMTQQELADKLGVTRETVNRMANGKPTDSFVGKFAKVFGGVETDAAFPQPQEA